MVSEPLVVFGACVVFYGAFSALFGKSVVSAPMLFMLAGLTFGQMGAGLFTIDVESHVLEAFGELTLGLILFADAASANSKNLLRDYRIPRRMLLLGLPLTIGFGTFAALGLFPDLTWQECALIAAILAPTDAALGYAVVNSKAVPERIRQGVLVESGFNDGLALPAVLLFAALTFSTMSEGAKGADYWLQFAGQQIIVGAVVGALIGAALGKFFHYTDGKE